MWAELPCRQPVKEKEVLQELERSCSREGSWMGSQPRSAHHNGPSGPVGGHSAISLTLLVVGSNRQAQLPVSSASAPGLSPHDLNFLFQRERPHGYLQGPQQVRAERRPHQTHLCSPYLTKPSFLVLGLFGLFTEEAWQKGSPT